MTIILIVVVLVVGCGEPPLRPQPEVVNFVVLCGDSDAGPDIDRWHRLARVRRGDSYRFVDAGSGDCPQESRCMRSETSSPVPACINNGGSR